MKSFVVAGALALSLLSSASAFAEPGNPAVALFAQGAALSNQFEIEEAKIILEDSQDPNVRQFAQMMIHDHGMAQAELRQVGARVGVPTDYVFDDVRNKKVKDLGLMDSPKLDQTYLADQQDAHALAAANLQEYIATGTDPALVAYARRTLPVVLEHQRILSRMTGVAPGV